MNKPAKDAGLIPTLQAQETVAPSRFPLRLPEGRALLVVTDFVDSVPDYLRKASVAVCPMRCGSGMKIKVLEAMACGTPVVATSLAVEGIQVTPGEHVLVGDTPEAFADHVIALLRDAERSAALARKARGLVEQRYSWRSSVSQLESVYEEALMHWRNMRAAESLQARPSFVATEALFRD